MNPEIKQKWVSALRSGEYKQGRCRLHLKDNTFCCLGVLCDLYIKEKGLEWEECPRDNFYQLDCDSSVLPKEVVSWAELNSPKPFVRLKARGLTERRSLDQLNDNGTSFEEIANMIEWSL